LVDYVVLLFRCSGFTNQIRLNLLETLLTSASRVMWRSYDRLCQDSVNVLFSVLWKQSLWWGCADASAVTDDSG